MLQPFEEFKFIYIKRLAASKVRYLVSQTYTRAYDHFAAEHKIDILLSPYTKAGEASMHVNALKTDKYASIIDLEKSKHVVKLEEMLTAESKYRLFFAVVKSQAELKRRLDHFYKEHLRRFINAKTNWHIGGAQTIRPDVDVTFGELFITFKHAGQTLRVKFEEIEKS